MSQFPVVDHTNVRLACSVCPGKQVSARDFTLLPNCTTMLTTGVSTTSKHVMSDDSWKIDDVRTYVARCSIKFSLGLTGDKAQTAWDCWLVVDRCPLRVPGDRASVYGNCIREKCYQKQFEFRYILNEAAGVQTKNRYYAVCNNLDKTEATMSYIN